MMHLRDLLPDVAANEGRSITPLGHDVLPSRTYFLSESYGVYRHCDCRRVLLSVIDVETRRPVATINYSFEPPRGRDADLGQIFLDPINPQSELSPALFDMVRDTLASDRDYHDRLVDHYRLVKEVIATPSHPEHARVRALIRDAEGVGEPIRRSTPKVGANDPCPCGIGKKFKRCCR